MDEKFNKNAKVDKLTKKVGRGVRLIVIGPYNDLISYANVIRLLKLSFKINLHHLVLPGCRELTGRHLLVF